jgi:hypothetical protein
MSFFIVENAIHTLSDDYTGNIINELFKIMLMNNGEIDNDLSLLKDFARIMAINLTIWVIDSSIQQQYQSSIVYCNQNGTVTFHSLYMCDNDNKKHTVLSANDSYICEQYQLFQEAFAHLQNTHESLAQSEDTEAGL